MLEGKLQETHSDDSLAKLTGNLQKTQQSVVQRDEANSIQMVFLGYELYHQYYESKADLRPKMQKLDGSGGASMLSEHDRAKLAQANFALKRAIEEARVRHHPLSTFSHL